MCSFHTVSLHGVREGGSGSYLGMEVAPGRAVWREESASLPRGIIYQPAPAISRLLEVERQTTFVFV